MHLGKPVLIVDGFAGPGKFEDGSDGSPLIIADVVESTLAKNLRQPQDVQVMCIERDDVLCKRLTSLTSGIPFMKAVQGSFSDFTDVISRYSGTHSVFLYADPFTVEGIIWDHLESVFAALASGGSVEMLLNFNGRSFVRRGLQALQCPIPEEQDDDSVDLPMHDPASTQVLDRVVGGDWWKDVMLGTTDFADKVRAIDEGFCSRLRRHFAEVCLHRVKEEPHHTVAKYALIFASRHPAALELMNEEFVKSRRKLANRASPTDATLFETRSVELVPDVNRIPELVLKECTDWRPRGEVILRVIRSAFGEFSRPEIRGTIEKLLRESILESSTGELRINDKVRIRANPNSTH